MVKTKSPEIDSAKKRNKKDYIYAVGRRRTANARVRLYFKKGNLIVNNLPIEAYFPGQIQKKIYEYPFYLTDTAQRFSATIKVEGSGKAGQLGAVVHGIARALSLVDEGSFRPILKKHGLLTRDPRMKERHKPGLAQAARAKKQSPKR